MGGFFFRIFTVEIGTCAMISSHHTISNNDLRDEPPVFSLHVGNKFFEKFHFSGIRWTEQGAVEEYPL